MNATAPATTPTTPATAARAARRPLSALARVSLVAQIIGAVLSLAGGIILQALVGHGVPLLFLTALFAAGAALTAAGFRWGTIPGALIGAAYFVLVLVTGNGYPVYHLRHPAEMYPVFAGVLLGFALAFMTLAASAAATIQNYASADRGRPAWLTPALAALAGVVIGALLLGALVQPAPASTGAASTINGVPAVHLSTGFDETSITIPVGSRLIFADDAGIVHILAYGSWDSNRPRAEAQPAGAPPLDNLRIANGTAETGPFTAAGTYHIYCLVHPGMNLTVIVQ